MKNLHVREAFKQKSHLAYSPVTDYEAMMKFPLLLCHSTPILPCEVVTPLTATFKELRPSSLGAASRDGTMYSKGVCWGRQGQEERVWLRGQLSHHSSQEILVFLFHNKGRGWAGREQHRRNK